LATTGTSVDRGRAMTSLSSCCRPFASRWAMTPRLIRISCPRGQRAGSDRDRIRARLGTNIETKLNQIRAEATAALLADRTLGLNFVHAIFEMGASQPELAGDLSKPAGRMEIEVQGALSALG
jgi:hypothetical protein